MATINGSVGPADSQVAPCSRACRQNRWAVRRRGTITDPHETLGGAIKIGVTLETVIDRTKFGLNWNAPLPKGGFALSDEVKLTVELELAQDSE